MIYNKEYKVIDVLCFLKCCQLMLIRIRPIINAF